MTDNLTPEKRSWNMSMVKSKDTKPEMRVRKKMHALGYRFRLHDKKLPGHPDIILKKYKTVIFVHGCFWHRHPGCPNTRAPKSRIDYWEEKFAKNIERDRKIWSELISMGWNVGVIWECETKDENQLACRIMTIMNQAPVYVTI